MNQVYIVCKQVKSTLGYLQLIPFAAFTDYPSALIYAQTIFVKNYMNPDMNARDLVYMLNITQANQTGAQAGTSASTSAPVAPNAPVNNSSTTAAQPVAPTQPTQTIPVVTPSAILSAPKS
jgi:hypothetical protein